MSVVGRIAPTPSGFLHQGNLFNFILNWLWAKSKNGIVLLRIDDLDHQRARPEYVNHIFSSLQNLGITWDIGPAGPEEFYSAWSQLHRMDLYETALRKLEEMGALFACECSRKYLGPIDGVYPGICACKGLSLHSHNIAWRIFTPDRNDPLIKVQERGGEIETKMEDVGSFIVRRKDQIPAYQLASLVDDVHFGITQIVRGLDLFLSTVSQMYLSQKLDLNDFSRNVFWHHPLLVAMDGHKLSKSAGNAPGNAGQLPSPPDVFRNFALWMGWPATQPQTLADLLVLFNEFEM